MWPSQGPIAKSKVFNLLAPALGPWMEDEGLKAHGPLIPAPLAPASWSLGPYMGVLLFPCDTIIPLCAPVTGKLLTLPAFDTSNITGYGQCI